MKARDIFIDNAGLGFPLGGCHIWTLRQLLDHRTNFLLRSETSVKRNYGNSNRSIALAGCSNYKQTTILGGKDE